MEMNNQLKLGFDASTGELQVIAAGDLPEKPNRVIVEAPDWWLEQGEPIEVWLVDGQVSTKPPSLWQKTKTKIPVVK